MNRREDIQKVLSLRLRLVFDEAIKDIDYLQEIRLRVFAPLIIRYKNEEYFISKQLQITKNREEALIISAAEIKETMEYISNYSFYAFDEEVRQGFITIQGGHRVGIAGKVMIEENRIKNMKHISFINIRLSHQVKGCADALLPYLRAGDSIYHTLIISPPGGGKTTLLRDIIRQLSDGISIHGKQQKGIQVGVIDERSEIAACHMGIPQNDLGIRTDVLDCCPKAKGMMLMIRSMSPRILAVDEIGLGEDVDAIRYAIGCGCKMIATVHGSNLEEIKEKPMLGELVRQKQFERYVVLSNHNQSGHIVGVYDEHGKCFQ